MEHFTALAGAAEEMEDVNTFAVVLAERPDGGGQRLEIQVALEPDEQDVEQGMDTYCFCLENGATHYGGMRQWRLHGGVLEIVLDESACSALNVDGGFRIELQLPKRIVAAVGAGLKRVFAPDR